MIISMSRIIFCPPLDEVAVLSIRSSGRYQRKQARQNAECSVRHVLAMTTV